MVELLGLIQLELDVDEFLLSLQELITVLVRLLLQGLVEVVYLFQ